MASVFDPVADFMGMVDDAGFPPSSISVSQINVNTGAVITTATITQAIGRTTDASMMQMSADGKAVSKGKRFFFLASQVSWALKIYDIITDTGGVQREISDVSLICFDTVYKVETHAIPS